MSPSDLLQNPGQQVAAQALARKWRPRTFEQLVGQEHVVRALANALRQNRLHHAYLLTGTRGVGKTTLARVMAKALNCETGVTPTPCCTCTACTAIDAGRFVDLIELDAASNTQVDNMRELLENALYMPTRGRFKAYIIDEVHMLSRSAFNAMLKTLEEPPEHVKFILATTDPQKVPVTVLSRCLQFNLKQIPARQIRERLEHILGEEKLAFEAPALERIARAAQGSLRDALSLLDQAIAHGGGRVEETSVRAMLGAADRSYLFGILTAVSRGDGAKALTLADEMQAHSLNFETALQDLAGLLHRTALAQSIPATIAADDPEREAILSIAGALTPEDVQLFYQIALHGRADFALAPDEYAGFTMPILRMLAFGIDSTGSQTRAPKTSQSPVARTDAPAPAQSTQAPIQPTQQAERGEQPPAAAAPVDWHQLVGQLKLGGMARMLAQHSELTHTESDRFDLTVPEAHRHLLEKPYRDKLQSALEEHFGRRVRLEFTIGAANGNTPAERADQERQARQRSAIEAIDRDPFVRELVENFDARVIDDSIRPVEHERTSESAAPPTPERAGQDATGSR
jgi:DNA polymerase-3 subunit gamma/tau